jgi:hypothetical protein
MSRMVAMLAPSTGGQKKTPTAADKAVFVATPKENPKSRRDELKSCGMDEDLTESEGSDDARIQFMAVTARLKTGLFAEGATQACGGQSSRARGSGGASYRQHKM